MSNQLHSQLATTQCNHGLCPIDDCVNFFITVQRIQASLLIDLGDNVTNLLCPGRAVVYFPAINTTYSIPSPCRAIVLSEPFLPPDTTSGVKSVSSSGARQIWLLVLLPVGVDLPSPNTKISTVPVTSAPVTRNVSEIALPPSGMTVLKRKDDYGPMKPSAKVASTVVLWQETSSSTCKFNGKNRNYFIIKATVADITLVSGFKFKPPTATTTTALIPVLTDLDQANVEGEVVDLLRESKARSLSFETASKQSSMTAFAEAYAICKLLISVNINYY